VRIFVVRARAIDPDFTLTETSAASVAHVCARLDGIPLAIELAASRIGVLAVEQIAERLGDSFRLLAGGARGGQTRHHTMEAALGWSYDLLAGSEQATFRVLSTFAGGFDLAAAEAIAGLGGTDSPPQEPETRNPKPETQHPEPDILDVLGRLVDKSLVVSEQTPHGRRYRLLEPVRQYARRALVTNGEEEGARTRHAAYYAAFAERVSPLLRGPEQIAWLDHLERERDNLRAALGWTVEHGEVDDALRLAVALTPYWEAHGYLSEGRRWLEATLAASRADAVSRTVLMQALITAGRLAHWQVDLDGAEALLTEALAIARELADRRSEGEALGWLASVHWQREEIEQGLTLGEACLRLGHEVADEAVIALALFTIGIALRYSRRTARALTVLDECVRRYRQLGDARFTAMASTMLGWAMLEAGELDRAAVVLRESALELRVVGDQRFFVYALRGLAHISHGRGEPRRALQLFGASEALRTSLGMRHSPINRAKDQVFVASLQQQLSAQEFGEAYAAGEAMSLDQVLADIGAAP
jgi:tetratricopeptide (TPR) repeat protein